MTPPPPPDGRSAVDMAEGLALRLGPLPAEATPDAVDVSDVGIVRKIVEEEQARPGPAGEGPPAVGREESP